MTMDITPPPATSFIYTLLLWRRSLNFHIILEHGFMLIWDLILSSMVCAEWQAIDSSLYERQTPTFHIRPACPRCRL